MSETTANPSPTDSPATPPAATETQSVSETVSLDGAAPAATKKKRKRKRKRKGPGTGSENASAAAVPAADVGQSRSASAPQGQSPSPQHAKGGRKDNGQRGNRRRPEQPNRHHRRDTERALRTQEQLASWRWIPSGTQLGYFPVVAPRVHPAPEVAPVDVPTDVGADEANLQSAVTADAGGQAPSAVTAAPDADSAAENTGSEGLANASSAEETVSHHTPTRNHDLSLPQRWAVPPEGQLGEWLTEALLRCPESEHAALLVSLCSHRAFRQRAGQLERAELRALVSVYDAVFLDAAPSVATVDASNDTGNAADGRDELRRGLEAVCHGSIDILRSWPLAARERLSELAEGFELDGTLQADAARLFFDAPKLVGRLGLRAVCDALSQGRDAAAKELIKSLGAQPGVPGLLPMLTEALEGQRFGSLVILSYGGAQSRGPDPKAPKRHAGFCLESQRDVWIRTGESPEAAAFEHYSQVHRRALLPGVVGLYSFGVTRSRKPYAAVLRRGISLQRKLGHGWGLPRLAALGLATELTLLASGLCRAGLRLPDLDARRFELDDEGRVWLSDLWGAELVEARPQDTNAVSVCRETVVHLLANQPSFALPNDWREVLSHSADFETIVATLRKLEKSRFWRS